MSQLRNMETTYSCPDATGARRMQAPSMESEYIIGYPNMQEVYPNVVYLGEVPYEEVSLYEEIINIQPNIQPSRRIEDFMSSGNNFCVDHRGNLGDSSTWFPEKLPLMYDAVQDIKPVESLQIDFAGDSAPLHYQELKVVTADNINIGDSAAIYDVAEINNQCHDASRVDDAVDSTKILNEDRLLTDSSIFNDPNFSLDNLLNDDLLDEQLNIFTNETLTDCSEGIVFEEICLPLPKLQEGLATPISECCNGFINNVVDFLSFKNVAKPDVFVDATAPQLKSEVSETQVQAPLKRRRGRPRKDATTQNTSTQKKHGANPFDAELQFSSVSLERKAKLACQKIMSTSMSEEDTSSSSFDEDYKPDCTEYSPSRKIRRVSHNVQDNTCSSTTKTVGACDFEKREKNNKASKESRDRKKARFEIVKTHRTDLEIINTNLKEKAAKLQKAINYIWSVLKSDYN